MIKCNLNKNFAYIYSIKFFFGRRLKARNGACNRKKSALYIYEIVFRANPQKAYGGEGANEKKNIQNRKLIVYAGEIPVQSSTLLQAHDDSIRLDL